MSSDLPTSETSHSRASDSAATLPATERQTSSQGAKTTFTVRQKILLAAVECSTKSERFTTDDLVLRAWELFPESFSLGGTEPAHAHPDSNRVLAKLSGCEGLRGLGWLELVDTSTYRVTRMGHRIAEQLRAIEKPLPERRALATVPAAPKRRTKTHLSRGPASAPSSKASPLEADITAVRWLERNSALRKFLRGSPLAFSDACSFWGITAQTTDVSAKLDALEEQLKRVVESFSSEGAADPRLPPLSTCYGLLNLHRLMRAKFAGELVALSSMRGGAP